jgi:hypothetical protein
MHPVWASFQKARQIRSKDFNAITDHLTDAQIDEIQSYLSIGKLNEQNFASIVRMIRGD